ncbi:unnamed protein product [Strongylus vulgaris]|uniref:Myosin N-terminal SH3-like domain-containing protein n=1 Tax=Strongylus vulgaris TaxID=40348 RepID=A0A3P7JFW8_STRVU|nr:unnamed protein product [Strongylus vulgaris]
MRTRQPFSLRREPHMEESDLRYLQVQRAAVADPARASEWAGKKLCWVPHEKDGFVAGSIK